MNIPQAIARIELESDTLDPDRVTRIIGLLPTEAYAKGDPMGRGPRVHVRGHWDIGVGDDSMENAARALLLQIRGRQQVMDEAAATCSSCFRVWLWSQMETRDVCNEISSDILIELASFVPHVNFWFTAMGPESEIEKKTGWYSGKPDAEGRRSVVIPRQAIVGLVLTSVTLDPAEVTSVIGLPPSRQHAKGELLPGRGIPEPCSLWALEVETDDIEGAAQALLSQIRGRQQAVREAAEKCSANVSLRVWWEPLEGGGDYSLSSELLIELASFVSRVDSQFSSGFLDLKETILAAKRLMIFQ